MGRLRILSRLPHSGSLVQWVPSRDHEVAQAKQEFEFWKRQGYTAYKRNGVPLAEFDAGLDEIDMCTRHAQSKRIR